MCDNKFSRFFMSNFKKCFETHRTIIKSFKKKKVSIQALKNKVAMLFVKIQFHMLFFKVTIFCSIKKFHLEDQKFNPDRMVLTGLLKQSTPTDVGLQVSKKMVINTFRNSRNLCDFI